MRRSRCGFVCLSVCLVALGANRSPIASTSTRPGPAGDVGYEVLSHVTLQPGRYQLRIGAFLRSSKESGSIYHDVDVPDVTKSPVALSALALTALPGVVAAVTDAMEW